MPNAINDAANQARSFAMGAFRGVGFGTETIGGNPAMLSMFHRYQVELGGAWDIPNRYGYGTISIVDSSTSSVAYGQSYTLLSFNSPEGRSTAHLNSNAISYALADWIHLGISGRYQLIEGAHKANSVTMGAGIALRLFQMWILGFSGHNLIPVNHPYVQTYFAFSTSVNLGGFTPAFEWRMDFNGPSPRWAFAGGVEWIAGDLVPIRAGFVWDDITKTRYVSGGLGLYIEGSGFDIAYRYEIGGFNGHLIALTIKLQSR